MTNDFSKSILCSVTLLVNLLGAGFGRGCTKTLLHSAFRLPCCPLCSLSSLLSSLSWNVTCRREAENIGLAFPRFIFMSLQRNKRSNPKVALRVVACQLAGSSPFEFSAC